MGNSEGVSPKTIDSFITNFASDLCDVNERRCTLCKFVSINYELGSLVASLGAENAAVLSAVVMPASFVGMSPRDQQKD